MAIPFTGIFGKLPLMSFQVAPPPVVRKTCPRLSTKPEKPEKATYAVVEVCGSTTTCVKKRCGRPVLRLFHTAPTPASALVVTWTRRHWCLRIPFEFVGDTAMVVTVFPRLPEIAV